MTPSLSWCTYVRLEALVAQRFSRVPLDYLEMADFVTLHSPEAVLTIEASGLFSFLHFPRDECWYVELPPQVAARIVELVKQRGCDGLHALAVAELKRRVKAELSARRNATTKEAR